MIEVLFVLSIAAFFAIGALVLYNQASVNNRNRQGIVQIQNVQQSVRTLYAGQANFGTAAADITAMVANAKTLPANMLGGAAGTITNIYGGLVSVAVVPAGTAFAGNTSTVSTFTVGFHTLPAETCITLATSDQGGGSAGSGLVGVASSAAQGTAPAATGFNAAPVTPALALTKACTAPTANMSLWFNYQ
jgi:hypothetical protein